MKLASLVALFLALEPDPQLVKSYLKDLDSQDTQTRLNAIVGLADQGAAAAPAIPALIKAFEAKDEDLRLNAAITLSKIGPAAVTPLSELLASTDADQRFYALWSLGWIGPAAKETAPRVIQALADKNEQVRRKAAYTLGRIASDPVTAIGVLVKALGDPDGDVRTAAAEAASHYGSQAVPALLQALASAKSEVKHHAASALGQIGSDAKDAVDPLKKLLLDPKESPGLYAEALAKIGKASIPALTDALKSEREPIRTLAVDSLHKLGAEGAPVLVDALGEKYADVRRHAAQFLGQMRISDKMVVLALAYALKDDDEQTRFQSMQALQQLMFSAGNTPPPTIKLAIPKLNEALTDLNVGVRQTAFQMLTQLQANPRPTLLEALASKDAMVRINTASLMTLQNVDRQTALPVLREGLQHPELEVRMQAAHALALSRQDIDKVTPILIDGLKSKSASVRQQAFGGLSNMGQMNKIGTQAMLGLLDDSGDDNFRQQVLWSLQNAKGDLDLTIPAIVKLIKSGTKNQGLRYTALQVLPMQGPKSIPHILAVIKEPGDENLRQQAVWALSNIQGDLKNALDEIRPLLKSDNAMVRRSIINLLPRLGEPGVEMMITSLKDADSQVRMQAAQNLRNMGPKYSKQLLPHMKELVKDSDPNVRNQAVWSLVGMGNEAFDLLLDLYKAETKVDGRQNILNAIGQSGLRAKALPLIREALKDPDVRMRQTAVQCMQYQGASKESVAALAQALQDKEASVRYQAVWSLANMGAAGHGSLEEGLKNAKEPEMRQVCLQAMQNSGFRSKTAVPLLIEALKDTQPQSRMAAANLLGNLGADAKAAVPMLTELLKDTNPAVRNSVQGALSRIK